MPELKDDGAIEAAIVLVQQRNRDLREVLHLSKNRLASPPSGTGSRDPIELHIRVKPAAVVSSHRIDVPADNFAAMPIRPAVYPQFQSRPR
jgi:hypothetical protein